MQISNSSTRNSLLESLLKKNEGKIAEFESKHRRQPSQSCKVTSSSMGKSISSADKIYFKQIQSVGTPHSFMLSTSKCTTLQEYLNSYNQKNSRFFKTEKATRLENSNLISASATQASRQSQAKVSLHMLSDSVMLGTKICNSCYHEYNQLLQKTKEDFDEQIKKTQSYYEEQIDLLKTENVRLAQMSGRDVDNKKLRREWQVLKIERDLYQKQHQECLQEMTKELELQKRGFQSQIESLQQQLQKAHNQVSEYRCVEKSVADVENILSKVLTENQSNRTKIEETSKTASSIIQLTSENIVRTIEMKDLVAELKSMLEQLLNMFMCFCDDETPSLEMILAQPKTKSTYVDHLITEQGDPWVTLHSLGNKDKTIKVQTQMQLNNLIEAIKQAVYRYQQKFLYNIGGYK